MSTVASPRFTPTEMMTIVAARALKNDDVCFVGIGAPSAACNLARLTHAPDITLIYESGTIATEPNVLPLSIGDGELCETRAHHRVGAGDVPLLAAGRPHLDRLPRRAPSSTRFANLNTTVIGDYFHPEDPAARRRRRAGDRDVVEARSTSPMAQTRRGMVEKIDFFTSLRPWRRRRSSPAARHRHRQVRRC